MSLLQLGNSFIVILFRLLFTYKKRSESFTEIRFDEVSINKNQKTEQERSNHFQFLMSFNILCTDVCIPYKNKTLLWLSEIIFFAQQKYSFLSFQIFLFFLLYFHVYDSEKNRINHMAWILHTHGLVISCTTRQ